MRVCWNASRTLALGMIFAVAGFCVSLATSNTHEAVSEVGSRSVGGSLLTFTNPLLAGTPLVATNPNEFDLGDALFGAVDPGIITRYITAAGGLRPYRFTSEGPLSLEHVLNGTYASLQLGISGALVGTMPFGLPSGFTTNIGTPGFRFQATVRDAQGGTNAITKSAFFNVSMITPTPSLFRFAADTLPSALVGQAYSAKLDVLGGVAPFLYSVVSVKGSSSVKTLEDLGLYITDDGTVIGNPLVAGTFSITVKCRGATGIFAQSRAGTGSTQVLTLSVNPNVVTSSDLITISCSIKGDSSESGKDSLKYAAAVNLLGQDVISLAYSPFAFRLGNIIYTGKLDRSASYKAKLSDGSSISVSVSAKTGLLNLQIGHGSFGAALDAANLFDGTVRRPVQISIGDALLSSEVLDFDTRVNSSGYSLQYGLGKAGHSAGGAFQVVSVLGKDGNTSGGQTGDAWKIGFLATPAASINTANAPGLDNVTSVTVRIGTNFAQKISGLTGGASVKYSGKVIDGIKKFSLDSKKGTGSIETEPLSTKKTSIPQAAGASAFGNIFLQLGVDLTRSGASFSGEQSRRVFGLKNQYKDAAP